MSHRRDLAIASALALLPAIARGQDVELAGEWRVRGRDGAPRVTGTVRIDRDGRYERRVRRDGFAAPTIERGRAILGDGLALVPESAVSGMIGVAGASDTTRRYRPSSGALLSDSEVLERRRGDDGIELRVDGREFFPDLVSELARARRSICIETYSWVADKTGRSVGAVLVERARAGVEVRVLVDSVGVWGDASEQMKQLRAAGCQVVIHNRLPAGLGWTVASVFREPEGERHGIRNHDHRKISIVDGRVAWTGGMNIADKYAFEWHDLQARLEGPVVDDLVDCFLDRWREGGGPEPRDPSRLRRDGPVVVGLAHRADLDVLPSVPGVAHPIRDAYVRELGRARERICVENPYLVEPRIVDLLQAKAREGIATTVIVPDPEHQDSWEVAGALRFMEAEIVKSGVDLRHYRDRMTHGKVAVVDHDWVTIGSANLDGLSLEGLSELNVETHDAGVAAHFEDRVFRIDLGRSDAVVPRKLPWWEKIRSGVLFFLRRFL